MTCTVLKHGSPELRAWLWSQLRASAPALIAGRYISRNKARRIGLIPNPYRDVARF